MLCRTRADYFQLWEEGGGPGQQTGRRVNPAEHIPCWRQGDYLRKQTCASCCGTVRLKVFACDLHGECTVAKFLSGSACCRTCDDYEPEQKLAVSENH
jgi:hypothetical protein